MLVRLANKWFAPAVRSNPTRRPNKIQSMSGRRFPAGKQEISDEYFDYLPKSAMVLRGPSGKEQERAEELFDAVLPPVDPNADLKAADVERAAGDAETEALAEAEVDDVGELNAAADAFRAELEAEDKAFLEEVEAEEDVRHARADEEAALARVKKVSHDTKPKSAKRGRPAKAKK